MGTLNLDSNGGTALFGPCGHADAGRRLTLAEPGLHALDVHEDSRLEVLDLRDCGPQDALHLQLSQLPALREIYLPELAEGAVIHLFHLELPPTLKIHGAIAELDADWQAGTLRLAARHRAWHGARLLGRNANTADLASRQEAECSLAVVMNPTVLPVALELTGTEEWLLADAGPLERCVVHGPPRVRLDNTGALASLALKAPSAVDVQGAGALFSVGSSAAEDEEAGYQVTLRGNTASLTLTGGWDDVQLHTPQLRRLALDRARQLVLHHCRYLDEVALPNGQAVDCYGSVPAPLLHQARFFMDEATLSETLSRIEAGETDLLGGVLKVLSRRYTAQAAFHGLTALVRLAESGIAPADLWECRRTLSAWHCRSRRKRQPAELQDVHYHRADTRWQWELPADRQDEGMLADLRLWALCVESSAAAKSYTATLRDATCQRGRNDRLAYVLRAATADAAQPVLIRLTLEVLSSLYGSDAWPRASFDRAHQGLTGYLPRLLSAAPITVAEYQAVLCAIAELTPWAQWQRQLTTLLRLAPGQTRALLMSLSRQPDDWLSWRLPETYPTDEQRQAARQQWVQMALMPVS
ncbi:hypothetical protein [Vreelandella jeotgali]|uniref:hypothetical protein n=1 Tax=Vreelandella jeotgali TaxID=553386 RepID=UPI00034B1325|nr:hypothetical protein [Halomonas jeotgali]